MNTLDSHIRAILWFALSLSIGIQGCVSTTADFQSSSSTTSNSSLGGSSGSGGGGGASVQISWVSGGGVQTGYHIQQSTDGLSFSNVATATASATTATITGLAASTTYYFRVQAYNSAGGSGYSPVITAEVP